jgi:hypothetical protein
MPVAVCPVTVSPFGFRSVELVFAGATPVAARGELVVWLIDDFAVDGLDDLSFAIVGG